MMNKEEQGKFIRELIKQKGFLRSKAEKLREKNIIDNLSELQLIVRLEKAKKPEEVEKYLNALNEKEKQANDDIQELHKQMREILEETRARAKAKGMINK